MKKIFLSSFTILILAIQADLLAQSLPPPNEQPPVTPPETSTDDKYGTPDTTADGEATEDGSDVPLDPEKQFKWNVSNTDIADLVKLVSKNLGINFILGEEVKGKITILSDEFMTREEYYQAFLSALEVNALTIVKTPSGLYKIVSTKDAIKSPLEIQQDNTQAEDRFITRIYQIKNISANDVKTIVDSLISEGGKLDSYPATNSLIITDTASNIVRIIDIIKVLDLEGPQERPVIIPIQYADAKDIADKIQQIYEPSSSSSGASSKVSSSKSKKSKEAADATLSDIPAISKVIADERTNSVIILGTMSAVSKVRTLISQLDTPINGGEGAIHVYALKYADAEELAKTLEGLVSDTKSSTAKKTSSKTTSESASSKDSDSKTAAATNTSVQIQGDVKVTADAATNSLVITASQKDYNTLLDNVISKLDIPRMQVFLEAVVLELTVDHTKNFGFGGNMGSIFSLFGADMTGFGAILPLPDISTLATAAGGFAGGVLSDRTLDFTTSSGDTVSVPAVSAILQALQQDSNANVLSSPSIMTLDNTEASINVGKDVPIPTGSTVGSGGAISNSIDRKETGIILTVTPQVSESDTVRLKLKQEISDVLSTDATFGATFTTRIVTTEVVANDKQTIVIGGLLNDKTTFGSNKIPLIGDVPVLGYLFSNRSKVKSKTNILVFITPYIIREKADYLAILERKIQERDLFIDLNYSTSQRKAIRESLQNHAATLLQYKGGGPVSSTTYSTDSTSTTGTVESGKYTPDQKVKYKN